MNTEKETLNDHDIYLEERKTLFNFGNRKHIDVTNIINEIETTVYKELKSYGFKRYGRTLHRFVSEDISQVIHFQAGKNEYSGKLRVNIGIRIPECVERKIENQNPNKKYYQECECTIRSTLGEIRDGTELWYNLRKDTTKITRMIVDEIIQEVLPVFDKLSTRQGILAYRRLYPLFDTMNSHLILLEESLIYVKLNDMVKAKELFDTYYNMQIEEYNKAFEVGKRHFLRKGERIVHGKQDITAEEDGFVILYGTSHAHIEYLERLATELGFVRKD